MERGNPYLTVLAPSSTIYSSPIPMTTFNDHLTTQMTACKYEFDFRQKDCFLSEQLWIPADLQLSVACNSITYEVYKERTSCPPHILADVLYVPGEMHGLPPRLANKFPPRLVSNNRDCIRVSQSSQEEECSREHTSLYERWDIQEPFGDLNLEPLRLKYCHPCQLITHIGRKNELRTTSITRLVESCNVALVPPCLITSDSKPYTWRQQQKDLGIEVYFFPQADDSKNLCATVPSMVFHNTGNSSHQALLMLKYQPGLQKSVMTMGKTMYEGTVYLRFRSIGALTPKLTTTSKDGFYVVSEVAIFEGLHKEFWAEVLPEQVSTMRYPDAPMRSYRANINVGSIDYIARQMNEINNT
jgi:hypothetical protein